MDAEQYLLGSMSNELKGKVRWRTYVWEESCFLKSKNQDIISGRTLVIRSIDGWPGLLRDSYRASYRAFYRAFYRASYRASYRVSYRAFYRASNRASYRASYYTGLPTGIPRG